MAATALIKLTQGANVGDDGCALKGVISDDVFITNVDNADVGSWSIELVYVDPASSLDVEILAFDDSGSVPEADFEPDVPGCYRLVLKVWEAADGPSDHPDEPDDVDIRIFAVPEANGLVVPPPQIWPLPLPDPRSEVEGAKPNEFNFEGQEDGWAGNGSNDGLANEMVRRVDAVQQIPDPNTAKPLDALAAIGLLTPLASVSIGSALWVLCAGDLTTRRPSSLVRFDSVTGRPTYAITSPNLEEEWLNVAVDSTDRLWVVGDVSSDETRFLRRITMSTTPPTVSARFPAGSAPSRPNNGGYNAYFTRPLAPLAYDGTRMWTVARAGALGFNTTTGGVAVTVTPTPDLDDLNPVGIAFDPTTSNYTDETERLWLLSEAIGSGTNPGDMQLDRLFTDGSIDATLAFPGGYQAPVQVLAGGTSIYVLAQSSSLDTIYRVNPEAVTVATSDPIDDDGLPISAAYLDSRLYVLATTGGHARVYTLLSLNATTLAVVDTAPIEDPVSPTARYQQLINIPSGIDDPRGVLPVGADGDNQVYRFAPVGLDLTTVTNHGLGYVPNLPEELELPAEEDALPQDVPGVAGRVLTSTGFSIEWAKPPVGRVDAFPTAGHWRRGDVLLWGADDRRLGLRATQDGALDYSARTDDTPYALGDLISQDSKVFICVTAGDTDSSPAAEYAAAVVGEIVYENTVAFECVVEAEQGPEFISIPNLDAMPVALPNTDDTLVLADGPVRECATADDVRVSDLDVAGAVVGDVWTFRRLGTEAFPWTFSAASSSGDVVTGAASTSTIIRFYFNATTWKLKDAVGNLG